MITDFTSADIPDQSRKTFFVTGADTGIGFEAAKAIAGKGGRVLLGARDAAKGQTALERITAVHPSADIAHVELDLADLESVKRAAEVVAQEPKLDVLVNNAGIMMNPLWHTKDGFEAQFGTNHLGHFALTGLLQPLLESTPGSRIVIVSSVGHRNGDIDLDDIDADDHYNPQTRYYQSKLANLLHMYELDRRLRAKDSTTIAVAVHPGGASTELSRNLSGVRGLGYRVLMPFVRPFANSAESGAWPTELGATAPGVEGGQYFGPSRFGETSGPARQVDSTDRSKDPQLATRLWALSEHLTGVRYLSPEALPEAA